MPETVTVTWTEQDTGGTGLTGSIRFQLSAPLDDTSGTTYETRPVSYPITGGTGQSGPLLANDDPGVPAGAWYAITIAIDGQQPRVTYRYLNNAAGASQALARLPLAVPAALAPGALTVPLGAPLAGDVPAVTVDGSPQTTWRPLPVADSTAADIQPDGVQAAGSVGEWADGGHVHPAIGWIPPDNGLLTAQGGDPGLLTSTAITVAGTLYLVKLPIRQPVTISSLAFLVSAAAVGTSTTTFCGLYSSAGTRLTGSADVGTPLKTAGPVSLPLTTPQALAAGTFVWAALLTNFGTTQPTLFKGGSITNNVPNVGLAASAYRWAVAGTGLSALPASIIPASNSITAALTLWCGAT